MVFFHSNLFLNNYSLNPYSILPMSSIITVTSTKSIDRVCADLEKAVSNHKFGVLGVHNLTQTMAKKGVKFNTECRIFEVCNPHKAKAILEFNLEISTALPCRISVFTTGDIVKLSTIKPTLLLDMFDNDDVQAADDLQSAADEVEEAMIEIMEEAAE